MPISSDDESDSMSDNSVTMENGNATKKPKIMEKDNTLSSAAPNKDKKNDVPKKDKPPVSINVSETIKDQSAGNKEVKTTTVMSMLRAQRDANILKTSSHIIKGSKSTSSATSDDSSSTDSDSSDSSSDADRSQHSDEDDFDSVKNKGNEDKGIDGSAATSNVPNKIQINGTSSTSSNNIPQEPDTSFFTQLSESEHALISQFIDSSKNQKDNFFQSEMLDLLYEYVPIEIVPNNFNLKKKFLFFVYIFQDL